MSRANQAWIWIAFLAGLGGLLYLAGGILLPFVAGMAVAYFLDPLADKLEKWGTSRTLATVLITLAFFAVVLSLLILLLPLLQNQILGLPGTCGKNPIAHESTTHSHDDRNFLNVCTELHAGRDHFLRRLIPSYDLQQTHDIRRTEEMQSYHVLRTRGRRRDLIDVQRRGIGSQNTAWLANVVDRSE